MISTLCYALTLAAEQTPGAPIGWPEAFALAVAFIALAAIAIALIRWG